MLNFCQIFVKYWNRTKGRQLLPSKTEFRHNSVKAGKSYTRQIQSRNNIYHQSILFCCYYERESICRLIILKIHLMKRRNVDVLSDVSTTQLLDVIFKLVSVDHCTQTVTLQHRIEVLANLHPAVGLNISDSTDNRPSFRPDAEEEAKHTLARSLPFCFKTDSDNLVMREDVPKS